MKYDKLDNPAVLVVILLPSNVFFFLFPLNRFFLFFFFAFAYLMRDKNTFFFVFIFLSKNWPTERLTDWLTDYEVFNQINSKFLDIQYMYGNTNISCKTKTVHEKVFFYLFFTDYPLDAFLSWMVEWYYYYIGYKQYKQ